MACETNPDGPERAYITIDESEITVDYAGGKSRIAVSSNCDWDVSITPLWCPVQKVSADGREYIEVDIQPNETDAPRETVVTVSYGRKASDALIIKQKDRSEPTPLKWYTFPVNSFTDVVYEQPGDAPTGKYRITASQLFVNPSLRAHIFPGNPIGSHTDDILNFTTYDNFTYNPVLISAFVNGEQYLRELVPAQSGTDEMAQQIIADLPKQNLEFAYSSAPMQYTSYRHLHLLGMGNRGLRLDEMVSGEPYQSKEMTKRTGLIYTYSLKLFTIIMDIPSKLINETVSADQSRNMSYIYSVSYGKTALLLVETDSDYQAGRGVVNKIIEGEALSDEESRTKDELTIYYLYFDRTGTAQLVKGDAELIGRFGDEINSLGIMPLNFTVNRFEDNAVGHLTVDLKLP